MSHTNLDPFVIISRRIKPLGLELTSGTATNVDSSAKTITITTPGGVSIEHVPYTGGEIAEGSQVWVFRNGTTHLAVGAIAAVASDPDPTFTFSTAAPAGTAPAGSVHLNTATWEIYEYV